MLNKKVLEAHKEVLSKNKYERECLLKTLCKSDGKEVEIVSTDSHILMITKYELPNIADFPDKIGDREIKPQIEFEILVDKDLKLGKNKTGLPQLDYLAVLGDTVIETDLTGYSEQKVVNQKIEDGIKYPDYEKIVRESSEPVFEIVIGSPLLEKILKVVKKTNGNESASLRFSFSEGKNPFKVKFSDDTIIYAMPMKND